MFPNQQNQNGQAPQPQYQPPQPQFPPLPAQPTYGGNVGTPQQTYDTLPPPNVTGHPTGHNPYEFIVNPNTPQKAGFGLVKDNFIRKILVIVGGAVVLMIVAAIALSALGPKDSTVGLKSIANRQQELIRISTLAVTKTSGQDATNFVSNVQTSVTSSQQDILGDLKKHNVTLKGKGLMLDQDANTDSLLTNAATAGNYDSAVVQTLTDQLKTYENLLQTTYKDVNNADTKRVLQSAYRSADLLIKQGESLKTPS